MPKTSCCRPRTLARHAIAHIEGCAHCGCVSIHLGAFTVRVDRAGLTALSNALGEAIASLHATDEAGEETEAPRASPFATASTPRTRGQA